MIINESFSEGNTFIHRIDPRVKLLSALVFSAVISVSARFFPLFLSLALSIGLLTAARLPVKTVLMRLLFANLFIFFLWVIVPFTMKGESLYRIGILNITKEGLIYCSLLTVKSNAIIINLIALTATMPVFTLGRAMNFYKVPAKIVNLMIFSYRYIHAILFEYKKLKEAMDIRGFQPKTNIHTYKTYAYLVGMLIVKSHDRAERVHSAMLCRGFHGEFFDLTEFSFKKADLIFVTTFFICLTAITFMQWLIPIF